MARMAIYGLLALVMTLIAAICVVLVSHRWGDPAGSQQTPPRPQTLEGWIERLRDGPDGDGPAEVARREAAGVIVARGPAAVLAALDATTKVPDDGRTLAISQPVIEAIASTGPEVVPAVVEGLSSGKPNVRAASARVLRRLGPAARDAVGPLTEALGDELPWVRWSAIDALGNIGPEAAAAVDALLPLVEHEDRYTREKSIVALGKIGPAAKAAAPVLRRIGQQDRYRQVRRAAAAALHQVDIAGLAQQAAAGADPQVRKLIQRLIQGDEFDSAAAAKELAELGPSATGAIPALAQMLTHKDKWRRISAAEALGAMGREARRVVPILEKLLEDEDPEVRAAAAKALERIAG